MYTELFILFIVHLIGIYLWTQRRRKNYPPGPWGIPILGNLLQIGNKPYKTFVDWKSKYGPVVLVYFGSFRTIAISDYKLIKQAMDDYSFSGRPHLQPFLDRSEGNLRGVLFGTEEHWIEQRRFMIKHLKELGFGKNSIMESIIQSEIQYLLEDMNEISGESISMKYRFNITTVNVLWKLITGERFQSDDTNIMNIFKMINSNLTENNGLAELGMFIPWLTKHFPKLSGYNYMIRDMEAILNFLEKPVIQHMETHQDLQPRDLLDIYIDEIKKNKDIKSSFYGDIGYLNMKTIVLDLFSAGGESTSTTLSWFFLYISVHPNIQKKLHEEIENIIGYSRCPNLSDKSLLPYLEATILEILRITCVVPIGIFHNTISNTQIGNYFIPKNTMIIPNIYSCHFDKEYWGDPEIFKPERFLSIDIDGNNTTIIKHDAFIPFSTGKRICPGENLVYLELFLIISNILQNFNISTDPNNPNPSLNPTVSFVLNPKPHKLVFTKKNLV